MPARMPQFLSRNAMPRLLDGLADFRVVVLNGPRQCGKTVLLGQLHDQVGGTFVTFDDPEVLESARADPVGFVGGFASTVRSIGRRSLLNAESRPECAEMQCRLRVLPASTTQLGQVCH